MISPIMELRVHSAETTDTLRASVRTASERMVAVKQIAREPDYPKAAALTAVLRVKLEKKYQIKTNHPVTHSHTKKTKVL